MNRIAFRGLHGRSAIVTASTSGIGFAIAQRLAQEGARVIISSRSEENVQEATKKLCDQGLDVEGLVCHVSNPEHRRRLFEAAEKSGGLDILVSSAGVNPAVTDVFDCPENAWDKNFDVNVKAAYLLSKEALPLLRQSKAGRIIYISSIAGLAPESILGAYSASKAALCALAKLGAAQLGKDNITVNGVVPGIIRARFSQVLYNTKALEEHYLSRIPLNRFGKPEEVSGLVALLASDEGAYISGENIVVGGGIHTRI